ncbi:DUF2306 domain-containing protein [Actinokineospora sp. HUAS TT18]|uniref:DUF2306 domain-containing protein n=1 Tax=Actinokineospora sp. HUAS TT18 TaxID=3447451 RepID=UPI003F51F342
MTTTETRPSPPKKRPVWVLPLGAVIVAFLAFSFPPYLSLDPTKSRVPEGFPGHYYFLLAHIAFGTVAIVSGFLQVWPWFRRKHRRGHRVAGRLYVFAGVIPAALAGLVVGATSPFGPVGRFSAVILVSLWLTTTIIGYRRARQRRFADHREWMIRSYTLTASTIVNRFWAPVLAISFEPYIDTMFDGSQTAYIYTVAGLTSWLSWVLPLIAVEGWLIHLRGRRKPAA